MKRQVLPRDDVKKALEKFQTVQLDLRRNGRVADRLEVPGSPTFVILDRGGNKVSLIAGYQSADQFISFLQRASASAETATP
jgi:predicted DsbA family dithiol-disulfide isomerase